LDVIRTNENRAKYHRRFFAALDAPPDAIETSLYQYRTHIEFPLKTSLSNAGGGMVRGGS
jgi:hypothetical protein